MCSSTEKVYKIEVEGTILNVCEKCSSFGRVVGKIRPQLAPKKVKQLQKAQQEEEARAKKQTETVQLVNPNYPALVKRARERMGLKQEDFAKKIAEKESVIHKLESGSIVPDLNLARKLERFLKIKLVDEIELEPGSEAGEKKKGSEGLTIGDLIKVK